MEESINLTKNIYLSIKRIIDVFIAIVGITFLVIPLSIMLFFISLVNREKDSIFFCQERIGKDGKKFNILKFRSMVPNAEKILEENEELFKKYKENNYKLHPSEDPRMTQIGRFLRKTNLDEFPQFINILKGEMSFVGPRPIVEIELKEYGDRVDKFLSVKPGATGWWQVSGRSEVGYPERCDLELYYVDNQSLLLDIKIIKKEILKIFKIEDGAY